MVFERIGETVHYDHRAEEGGAENYYELSFRRTVRRLGPTMHHFSLSGDVQAALYNDNFYVSCRSATT